MNSSFFSYIVLGVDHMLTSLLTGIGLSMDAFSLSILYGTLNLKKKKMIELSIIVGIFHFFMPMLGFFLGNTLLEFVSINPNVLVSVIFILIAIQMLLSLTKEEEIVALTGFLSLFMFGLTVSIDSFSVGIGLSALESNIVTSAIIFSLTSCVFTFTGLVLGTKLNKIFGNISTLIGSVILLILGIYHFFC